MFIIMSVEIIGCYDSANVQYNENLKTADIQLQSSDNPLCNKFQNEVQVVVSFHDQYIPILFIQEHFNYTTFTKIEMKNVSVNNTDPSVTEMPKYAYLNISNIAFWTTVRVSEISKQSSQMDQCFEQQGSTFAMARGSFTVVLNLTTACLNEIIENAYSYQYSFNNRAGTVNIILQRNDPDNYNCWVEEIDGYNYFNCINNENYLPDVQLPFISPLFQFFVLVGDRTFTTEIRVTEILVGRVGNLFESIVAQFYKDAFYIKYVFNSDSSVIKQSTDAIVGYTRIIYRLSIKAPTQDLSYEFILPTFSTAQNYLIHQCENEQSCLQELTFINQNAENSQFQLNCFAFDGDVLLTSVGQAFTARLSCFQRTVVQIYSPQKVCFQLEKSPFFESAPHCVLLDDGEEVEISAQSILTAGDYQVEFQGQATQNFYYNEPVFCLQCDDCVNEIENMRISGVIVILYGLYHGVQFTALGSQIQEMKYSVVVIVVCVFGAAFICYVTYDSISKLVMFMKLAQKYKHKR